MDVVQRVKDIDYLRRAGVGNREAAVTVRP
jgi:hypothetical protein